MLTVSVLFCICNVQSELRIDDASDIKKLLIEERRFFAAKKAGKSAYFSRASPINCLLMADYFLLRLATQTMFFVSLFPF